VNTTSAPPRESQSDDRLIEAPESTPSRVRLVCVSASAWHKDFSRTWPKDRLSQEFSDARDGYMILRASEAVSEKEVLAEWRRMRAVVWLELAMPEDPDQWFEGIADPWRSMPTPEIDWSAVEGVLTTLELIPGPIAEIDHESHPSVRLLALLPHLYALGVARIRREVVGRKELTGHHRADEGLLFFPTVGFQRAQPREDGPAGESAADSAALTDLWTVRMSVGVVGNTVITVRLPDLLCTGIRGSGVSYRSALDADLPVPRRFLAGRFPKLGSGPEAKDIAEAIAIQHAATARAVAEQARTALRAVEVKAGLHLDADTDPAEERLPQPREALHELEQIAEIAQQIDRQLSRELRRLTDYGDREEVVAAHAKVRYTFALDEIHALRSEISTARAAIVGDIQARDQDDREKFQFIVALLGSAILIPTLVAAIYGANVNLPGEDSWTGFIALLLFVISFAVLGVLTVNELWARGWVPRQRWLERVPVRLAAAGLGVVTLILGIVAAI
jgi:hypothetical protein